MFNRPKYNPYAEEIERRELKNPHEIDSVDAYGSIMEYANAKAKFFGLEKGNTMSSKRKYRMLEDNVKTAKKLMTHTLSEYYAVAPNIKAFEKTLSEEKQAYEKFLKAHPEKYKTFCKIQALNEAQDLLSDLKKTRTK